MELTARLERLENQRMKLWESLKEIPEERLNKKPDPSTWSVCEVLHHLRISEELSISYIRKKTNSISSASTKAGFGEWFRSQLLKAFLNSSLKMKTPAILGKMPEKITARKEMILYEEHRKKMKQFVLQLPGHFRGMVIYRHPVAGMLSLDQALMFIEQHFKRHTKQIEKILMRV